MLASTTLLHMFINCSTGRSLFARFAHVVTSQTLSRNAKLCMDALETQPGAKYAEGSWWQAYNSVTFITDHVQGRNADNRLYSSWFGGNQVRKKNALETAIEFAEAA